MAGALQLRVQRGPFGAVNTHGPDKGAGSSAKDEIDAILRSRAVNLDGLVETGGVELAQAFPYVVRIERLSFGLGKWPGSGVEAVRA